MAKPKLSYCVGEGKKFDAPTPAIEKTNLVPLSLEEIASESVMICKEKNRPIAIVGGNSDDVIGLSNKILSFNPWANILYMDARPYSEGGFDYLKNPYFIELDKIKIIKD